MSRHTFLALGLVGAALSLAVAACDSIIGVPKRHLAAGLDCSNDGTCSCAEGFADCDKDPENGCEADLTAKESCGACGVVCDNADCTKGACVCRDGYADCDGKTNNGCETSLDTDAENCGACRHSCLGGKCEHGRCQPIVLTKTPTNDPFKGIAVDASSVYWVQCGAKPIHSMPTDGGAFQSFGQIDEACQPNALTFTPCGIILRDGLLSWTSGVAGYQASVASLGTQTACGSGMQAQSIAVSDAYFYVVNELDLAGNLTIERYPIAGGPPDTLDSQFAIGNVVATSKYALWNQPSRIKKVSHGSTSITVLVDVPKGVAFIAADEERIYWSDFDQAVYAAPLETGSPAVKLADGQFTPCAMTSDGTHLYWENVDNGAIMQAPVDGSSEAVTLAKDQYLWDCAGVAVDDKAVYWTGKDQVFKVAK